MREVISSLAVWLQDWPIAQRLRASPYIYPLLSTAHIASFSILVGAIFVVDMNMIRGGDLDSEASALALLLARAGFGASALTGTLLSVARATDYVQNPFMAAKFSLIFVAGVNAWRVHWVVRNQHCNESRSATV